MAIHPLYGDPYKFYSIQVYPHAPHLFHNNVSSFIYTALMVSNPWYFTILSDIFSTDYTIIQYFAIMVLYQL